MPWPGDKTGTSAGVPGSGQSGSPESGDLRSHYFWAFMLPDMNGGPAQLTELLILTAVSLDVVIKLRLPPVMVVLGEHGMVRAHVPEASVNEDRDPGPREDDVRSTREGA